MRIGGPMKAIALLLFFALLLPTSQSYAQEKVQGTIYFYTKDGNRIVTSNPVPPPGAMNFHAFPYSYYKEINGWALEATSNTKLEKYYFRLPIQYEEPLANQSAEITRVSVLGKIEYKKEKKTEFVLFKASINDCTRGFGQLVWENFDGSVLLRSNFVTGETTISSILGSNLCLLLKQDQLAAAADAAAAAGEAARQEKANASHQAQAVKVFVGQPALGSETNQSFGIVNEKKVFDPMDTIYLSIPTQSDEQVPGQLSVRWWYQKGTQQVTAGLGSKDLEFSGAGKTVFFIKLPTGFPQGNYGVDIMLNGQQVRSALFSVAK